MGVGYHLTYTHLALIKFAYRLVQGVVDIWAHDVEVEFSVVVTQVARHLVPQLLIEPIPWNSQKIGRPPRLKQ